MINLWSYVFDLNINSLLQIYNFTIPFFSIVCYFHSFWDMLSLSDNSIFHIVFFFHLTTLHHIHSCPNHSLLCCRFLNLVLFICVVIRHKVLQLFNIFFESQFIQSLVHIFLCDLFSFVFFGNVIRTKLLTY